MNMQTFNKTKFLQIPTTEPENLITKYQLNESHSYTQEHTHTFEGEKKEKNVDQIATPETSTVERIKSGTNRMNKSHIFLVFFLLFSRKKVKIIC